MRTSRVGRARTTPAPSPLIRTAPPPIRRTSPCRLLARGARPPRHHTHANLLRSARDFYAETAGQRRGPPGPPGEPQKPPRRISHRGGSLLLHPHMPARPGALPRRSAPAALRPARPTAGRRALPLRPHLQRWRLRDLPGRDARRAHPHAPPHALRVDNLHRLQIRQPPAPRLVMGVADVVSRGGTLATHVAHSSHRSMSRALFRSSVGLRRPPQDPSADAPACPVTSTRCASTKCVANSAASLSPSPIVPASVQAVSTESPIA